MAERIERGGQMSDGPEASMAEDRGAKEGKGGQSLVSRSGREESGGTLGEMVEESQGRGEVGCAGRGWRAEKYVSS